MTRTPSADGLKTKLTVRLGRKLSKYQSPILDANRIEDVEPKSYCSLILNFQTLTSLSCLPVRMTVMKFFESPLTVPLSEN